MLKLDKRAYLKYGFVFKIDLQKCYAKKNLKIGFVFSFDSFMLLKKSLLYLNNNVLKIFVF